MSEPKVTVLMPALNGADYLREAVDSVLAQTMPDFELLVIDNASTDATPDLLRGYDDPRLRVLRNDRTVPLPVSLNRGLAEARTPLVARLDADDIAKPMRLERQLAAMRPGIALLGTWWDDFWEQDGQRRIVPCPETATEHDAIVQSLAGGNPIAHPSVLLDRAAALAVGGYPEDFAYAQDYALWLRLARTYRLAVLPERLVMIRTHAAQLSTAPSWGRTRLQDVIRLHGEALTLPTLSAHGASAARWALAKAHVRLSLQDLHEGRALPACGHVLRGGLCVLRALAGGTP